MRRTPGLAAFCSLGLSLGLIGCGGGGPGAPSVADNPLVSGLQVSEVALFQSLKGSLMVDGAAATSAVPIIAGRPGMLRIYVKPTVAWTAREIIASVTLTQNGAALPALESRLVVRGASTDADLDSTFNIELPGATITSDLTYAVELHEATPGEQGADVAGARYPASGEVALGAQVVGTIKIQLVPIQYGADGSNRMPATSDTDLARFRERMMALYPVSDVEITVGEPMPWKQTVGPYGDGWDELLNAIVYKRAKDGAPSDVYYYGLFTPTASFYSYCEQGCILGLSPLAYDPSDEYARASIGVGFIGRDAGSDETFAHEIGHANGRQHAPCDVQDPDRKYPYDDGMIGVWGYDPARKAVLDPMGDERDMMGYCSPLWVSDYTFKGLFKRLQSVNGNAARRIEVPTTWQSLLVRPEGIKRGEVMTLNRPPQGEEKVIQRIKDGRRQNMSARFYPFDHLPGGLLFVPADEDLSTLRIDGHTVD
jgi:hypothetical protein